jgi:glycosyltransferase involved in cell wall biosynthesis
MKVAFLIWSGGEVFGGQERRYLRLAEYLAFSGLEEAVVLAHKRTMPAVASILPERSALPVVFFGGRGSLAADIADLQRHLSKVRPDHLHVCLSPGKASAVATLLCPLTPVSIAMTDSLYLQSTSRLDRICAAVSCRMAKSIDCLSPGVKSLLLSVVGAGLEHKMRVTPGSFTDLSRVKESLDRDIDVVTMARFVPGKGYELLAEAADELRGVNLHMCGFGPMDLSALPFKSYRTDDPFGIMAQSKVFLSIQRDNNYPSQSTLEAMASGCAIIATDVGETRRFLDESCAVLIPNDPKALSDAIRSLLNDSTKMAALAANARKKVFSEHSIERYASHFLEQVVGVRSAQGTLTASRVSA